MVLTVYSLSFDNYAHNTHKRGNNNIIELQFTHSNNLMSSNYIIIVITTGHGHANFNISNYPEYQRNCLRDSKYQHPPYPKLDTNHIQQS